MGKTIDQLSTKEVLQRINEADKVIPSLIEERLDVIEDAVDLAYQKFLQAGRIIYCGAGSSGRIAAMDAAEMQPTYGIDPTRYFGLLAGGEKAMLRAVEQAEDSEERAIYDLESAGLTASDVVVAVAASGKTPYCLAALNYGKNVGALTISLSCVENSIMSEFADVAIDIPAGKEIVSGSTRMKAGTIQKMVLNMFSTALMIRLGKVYEGLMVNVQATNQKLFQRSIGILMVITKVSAVEAEMYLKETNYDIPVAVLMIQLAIEEEAARALLAENHGNLANILKR